MNEHILHRRNFLLHLRRRPGCDGPILVKEPARDVPSQSAVEQLHNEYAITCQLTDVKGVRAALGQEGSESRPVLLLEYIQGHSLAELIRTGSLDLAEKLLLAANVVRALSQVHTHHVMHRDLSSGNILVAEGDSPGTPSGVYIIDFGNASTRETESPSLLAADDTVMGTLAYISPEQTGRMNRRVDYRADLYSLGITLYELFTGRLPFDSRDPLGLIHDHVARMPTPPQDIESGIPGPVSDIVLKLLQKDADDRYQTARGLHADLERCLAQWQRNGRIEPFELGRGDLTGRLQIPQKLYGRQGEIEHIQDILARAVAEQAQLLLVAGYSGVGKTSLVREIQKDVIERKGTYIEGKFDQAQRTRPYSAWAQAFSQLVNNWLGQSETSTARWRDTILDAVGDQGQVLIDVVPALECILGPQPDVAQLGGVENQRRINYFFNLFIACLATPEHPLVVFLDDLQWVDPASLTLLEGLVTDHNTSRLLVIGAYRSNEVGPTHPLVVSQDRMLAETHQVTLLKLEDISGDAIDHLLADTLRLAVADCRDLGRVLVEKSGGNPFFFRQLLYALEAEGLLEFDHAQGRWMWDDSLRRNVHARGSVVDLMVETIGRFSADTQRALSLAACIASRFDLTTLQTILDQPRSEALTALKPALDGRLILGSDGDLYFAHDRIQEAAYSLIPAADRPRLHLEIGRRLRARALDDEPERQVFSFIGHLNVGRALIDTDEERIELAGFNLSAGQGAKKVSAYADAKTYVEIGLELLGADPWQDRYDLTLALYTENAELAYLTGQFEELTTTAALVHANARHSLDRARIYMTQIEAATARSLFTEGLDLGLAALRDLGVEIPVQATPQEVLRLHERFVGLLTNEPLERLNQLPRMSDETAMATSALLASVMSTAYVVNPPLFPIISYQGGILTFEFGVDVWSPFFVGGIALTNVASITPDKPDDDARQVLRFTRTLVDIIKALLDNPIAARGRTKGLMMLAFTTPWFETYQDSIGFSRMTYASGHETGDWLYGSYGAALFADQGLSAGTNLPEYQQQLTAYTDSLQRMGQVLTPTILAIHLQAAENFSKPAPEPHRLKGAYFDEDEWLSQATAANDLSNRHWLSVTKLTLAYHFDRDEALADCLAWAEKFLAAGACLQSVAQFYLYQALAGLKQPGNGKSRRRAHTLDLVARNLRWMKRWSESTPSKFQHKYHLIAAEVARVTGDVDGALSHYEQTINGARASGFTHEEALANELYARFWADRGHDRFASLFMREAQSLYRKWGAHAKAEHLAKRFGSLLVGRSVAGGQTDMPIIPSPIGVELDLRTVLKTSQNIASEIELDGLLARLMADAIENTGAQRGFLILERNEGWAIEARAFVDEPESYARISVDVAGSDLLAENVVRYVARTKETVVLDDASKTGMFVHDRYVQARRARSILCVPLVNQGKTSAILYLENNLASGVFSPQRVALLRLLSSQMAISIDNARIHADLERLLESRSKALASAEAQVRTLFENSPLGIALTNPEGRFLSVNKAVLQMVRLREEELLEHSVLDFYDDPSDRDALLRQVQKSGVVQDFGVQLVRQDGSHFYASLNMSKLVLEGNEVLLTMIQDVTSQITAEQETAVLEERARLARELHDAVSQTILSASLLADSTARAWEEGYGISTEDLRRLSRLLRGALDEMRTLLFELRPAAVRDRTLGQLLAALVETMRTRSSAPVELETKGDHVLPEQVSMTLHRIAQESLNNAVRHASAKTIRIDLVSDPDEVVLRIADDGQGFDADARLAGHHGLDIMRERAEEIGAVLGIESRAGFGTRVTVTWS